MAILYVKSGASGAADGSTWADAFTALATAVNAATAGDTIYVSHAHSETASGTVSKTGATTKIICVNDGAEPPTTLASTGVVANTTGLIVEGDLFIHGLTFKNSTGGTATALYLGVTTSGRIEAESCTFEVAGGTTSALYTGAIGSGALRITSRFKSCSFKFSAVGQTMILGRGRMIFEDCTLPDSGGTVPTVLISASSPTYGSNAGAYATFTGCNFSAATAGKTLFGESSSPATVYLVDCTYNSAATLAAAVAGPGAMELFLKGTSSSNINYGYAVRKREGTVDIDTTRYITTGGATDGVTPYSWKIVGTANTTFHNPLRSEFIYKNNNTVDTDVTCTIEGLIDAAAAPNDNEVWAEFFYYAASGTSKSTFNMDDRMTLMDSSTQAQTAGTGAGSWTKDTAVTGWVSFKCHATLTTPRKKGYIGARICMGANKTVYINPDITFS